MKDILEKRISDISVAIERHAAEYNALVGRLSEAKELLASWYKSQCEEQRKLNLVSEEGQEANAITRSKK